MAPNQLVKKSLRLHVKIFVTTILFLFKVFNSIHKLSTAITFYKPKCKHWHTLLDFFFPFLCVNVNSALQALGALWYIDTVLESNLPHLQCTLCPILSRSSQVM